MRSEQLKEMIESANNESYSVYLREIALLMEENELLREKLKKLTSTKS